MRRTWAASCCVVVLGGCASTPEPGSSGEPVTAASPTTSILRPAPSSSEPEPTTTLVSSTSTTLPRPIHYVFPFAGTKVSYGRKHKGYPATDVFGCGATVVAPIGGTVVQTRDYDPWNPRLNDPATRGGRYVTMVGDDGVRYYFAHLAHLEVSVGQIVDAGDPLGVMGQTGDARATECHTHVGISWPCPNVEWAVRRGEVWPWKYLDSWRKGGQLSPVKEVATAEAKHPDACSEAAQAPSAGAA